MFFLSNFKIYIFLIAKRHAVIKISSWRDIFFTICNIFNINRDEFCKKKVKTRAC